MKFCSLYSGSSGNSIFIASEEARILIDAGLPGKKIDEALKKIGEDPKAIDGIFITHEHSDHIKGVGVVSRKYDIPIYANANTWTAMENNIGKIKEHNIKIIDRRSTIEIKDLDIKSFNIPHDAIAPCGYTIHSKGKNVSVATDFGIYTQEIKDNIKDSDVILLESNHDVSMLKFGPYPYSLKRRILSEVGHLSNEDCGRAIVDLLSHKPGKNIILGHLSGTNNHPDLAFETVLSVLNGNNIIQGEDIKLSMASRHEPSNIIEF
ncbi:MBL fold metallo-hydrolase [Clostridium chauvoei]|uniref:MBL fold metallo-hydrolase n=2 Tax=Clostridium chauvoei TaxID=46867 RepID=A0ABD4RKN9_9CLOT|nr:MBL fold metallo-hydrolase [Clostridium chauvoei]ATD56103.1 MBL fold metallo-hydrolase [Clostridium chauvoei]ATD58593.1 MBL fold metallo-hydrolase [Clostridium chauvoei]MBX7281728.1 MBL fold metallo-hydrolase [Clostridium chauvoei]MBX7284248.1 MBL fold metallo-hydrolase [Clostridium chauvoei]MBX7286134.1 MBL fold metallo-hydrolase [Clostridium chauvoei]